jgi:glyoxalase family protein
MQPIPGLHHITAIASDPQRNVDFYTEVLGLRLVKKTVNFDDPETYHFYYGDDAGTPGTILTFFPWKGASRGVTGTGETGATAFRAPAGSLTYWEKRLNTFSIPAERTPDRFGSSVLRFGDPDGMALEIVEDSSAAVDRKPSRWSNVEPAFALNGFHSVTLALKIAEPTAAVLRAMGFQQTGEQDNRIRFTAKGNGRASIVDLLVDSQMPTGSIGAGSVHHIAFRVTDDADQLAWSEELINAGQYPTPVRDRTYFHSIYFREPGGALFELATDPPGFAFDEPLETLGEALKLPPWIEKHRSVIENLLPEIALPVRRQEAAHD